MTIGGIHLDKTIVNRLFDIQDAMQQDPDCRSLYAEHAFLNARFLETVESLTAEQKDAVFDYIGLLVEMHLRTLMYAVSQ